MACHLGKTYGLPACLSQSFEALGLNEMMASGTSGMVMSAMTTAPPQCGYDHPAVMEMVAHAHALRRRLASSGAAARCFEARLNRAKQTLTHSAATQQDVPAFIVQSFLTEMNARQVEEELITQNAIVHSLGLGIGIFTPFEAVTLPPIIGETTIQPGDADRGQAVLAVLAKRIAIPRWFKHDRQKIAALGAKIRAVHTSAIADRLCLHRIAGQFPALQLQWDEASPMATFAGVELDPMTNRVVALQLQGVRGELSLAIRGLSALRVLRLFECHLDDIPVLADLPLSLSELRIVRSSLRGTIPPTLGQLSQLRVLDLSGNQLRGTIPPTLGQLSQLRVLDLSGNQLRGTIPPTLGQLSRIETLRLARNKLIGIVPEAVQSLQEYAEVDLSHNRLSD